MTNTNNEPENDVERSIARVCSEIQELLISKNRAYGNSALDPLRCFSKASPVEQILVRIDDKLSRLSRGGISFDGEDTEKDLIGYLVLLRVARGRGKSTEVTPPKKAEGVTDEDGQVFVQHKGIRFDLVEVLDETSKWVRLCGTTVIINREANAGWATTREPPEERFVDMMAECMRDLAWPGARRQLEVTSNNGHVYHLQSLYSSSAVWCCGKNNTQISVCKESNAWTAPDKQNDSIGGDLFKTGKIAEMRALSWPDVKFKDD